MDIRNHIGLYGSYFLCMAGIGFILPYLPLYLRQQDLSEAAIGLIWTLAALAGLLQFPLGVWSDRLRARKPILLAALAVLAVATYLLAEAQSPLWLGVLAVLFAENGACRATVESLTGAEAVHLAPPSQVGAALGSLRFWRPVGIMGVALLGSLLVDPYAWGDQVLPSSLIETIAVQHFTLGSIVLLLVAVQGLAFVAALFIHEPAIQKEVLLPNQEEVHGTRHLLATGSDSRHTHQVKGERGLLSPSPLVGEGWGGGEVASSPALPPPTLTLPHKGGGNKAIWRDGALWAFVAAMVLFHAAAAPGGAYLGLFVKQDLGASDGFLPSIFIVMMVAWMLLVRPAGWLADRVGRKPLLLLAWSAMTLRLALIALAASPQQVLFIQVLDGLAQGLFGVLAAAWVTDRFADPRRAGEAQVLVGSCLVLGSAVGPLLAGLLVHAVGYRVLFGLLSATAGAATLLVLVLVPETLPAASCRLSPAESQVG